MKWPVAAMLAAFACGVAAVQTLAELPPWPAAIAVVGAGALVALLRRTSRAAITCARCGAVALVIASAVFGVGYAAWRAEARLADALAPEAEVADVRIVGVVDELPQNGPQGARFAFAVEGVVQPDLVVPKRLSLAWFAPRAESETAAAIPEIHAGERWQLNVRLKRPHGYINPAGFDLEAWLLEHNLRATGYVRDSSANLRLAAFVGRPSDFVQRAREAVRARIVATLPGAPYAGVLVALAIGDQRAIPEAQWLVFNRTGVSHLISISGLHVTVFAALAASVALGLARRSPRLTTRMPARKIAVAAGACAAFGYVLLAGAEVPAVRTLLMLWVASLGLWLARPGTASLTWLWALAIVLLWDPWASLSPGFWLSFGAVGLLLYAGTGRLPADRAPGWRARLAQLLRNGAHAQWVVTLGLVPGTVALFQQVSLVSAVANAIAIPVVTLTVVPLALAGIAIPLDALWQAAHAIFAILMTMLEALSAWPAATWVQHAPSRWTVVVAMLGVALILAPRGVPGRWVGALWLLPMFCIPPERPPEGAVRITTLDVGQGLAVSVETRTHALLYDTGPRFGETSDAGGRIIAPYVRARGLRSLDVLVVSHADLDHSGGALTLLQTVAVTTLYSSLPVDHPIVARAASGGTAWRCQAGQRWRWDGVLFEFLSPLIDRYAQDGIKTNDLSCVLKITAGQRRALLAGDIEAPSEAQLLRDDPRALGADILIVPHHGSRTSSTPAFVAAVAPRVAVFAAGYLNRFDHPRADVVARYTRRGAAPMRTDLMGAVTVTLGPGDELDAAGERHRRRRYWYDPLRAPP
ncbi:MAG: DNA internalization-related competence protein ComEC/Rec2 [Casimicrobiaceae bacterium]